MADTTELMNEREAAQMLGVKPGTLAVWRCTERVKIPFVKLGDTIRYKREDLEAFIERNTRHRDGE